MSFLVKDHSADLALQLDGLTRTELCQSLVAGLCQVLGGEDLPELQGVRQLSLEAETVEALLVRLANEQIFSLDARRELWIGLNSLAVFPMDGAWHLECWVAWTRPPQDRQGSRIKAATWHGLELQTGAQGLTATILFDL